VEKERVMAGKSSGGKVGRNSGTGRFTTVKEAKAHPKTHEVERIQEKRK
jgi:hypothetical protein